MIKLEREGRRGDPERETKGWLDKLAEVDCKRSGFQEMAAEGLITFDELRAKLAALDATRTTAERELETIKGRREHLDNLERDKEVLLETYAALTMEALESLTSEERQKLYKTLRLRAVINLDGSIEVGGTFVDNLDACTLEALSSWSPWAAAASSATLRPKGTSNPCASSASRPGVRRFSSLSSPTSA
jgi:hypothetical protein